MFYKIREFYRNTDWYSTDVFLIEKILDNGFIKGLGYKAVFKSIDSDKVIEIHLGSMYKLSKSEVRKMKIKDIFEKN
jgi:hypothetical protein